MKVKKPSCESAKKSFKYLKSELDRYKIDKTLAKGAEGYIKLAKDKSTKERVVIKFFNFIDDTDEETGLGIPHEIKILRYVEIW